MALMHQKQFLPYAVGNKTYGGGRSFPNLGPSDPTGYKERDLRHKARRAAILRRLKAKQKGAPFPESGRKV